MAALAALFGFAVAPRLGARRFVMHAAGGSLVAITVLVPWWIRNAYVLHAVVPLNSVGGLSPWVGEMGRAVTHKPSVISMKTLMRMS